MTTGVSQTLCSPGGGLSCFACCPPIRPAGYDHADHRPSLRRLFSEARQDHLAGRPVRPMQGFVCSGLGFLDAQGRQVGCLYHPARHGGVDLRLATGYQPKCARESCPQARAFALLPPPARQALVDLCAGLDAFAFSSPRHNPLMRLLALGPEVAGAALDLPLAGRGELASWPWLEETPPAWGWLLGRLLGREGPGLLRQPGLAARLAQVAEALARQMGPAPPLASGRPLAEMCDEWEARFWRGLSGRSRASQDGLERWRGLPALGDGGQAF
ncbi:MAG: hypothetical protein HY910_09030 [Desulfarculus sp.]|nr:hypothetical protein [Desulfarculus sp.]